MMERTATYTTKRFLLGLAIIVCCVIISFILFYPSSSDMGKYFTLSIIFMVTQYFALILGLIVLLLAFAKSSHQPASFTSILLAELNILTAITSIFLYFTGEVQLAWLNRSLLNLLAGVLLLVQLFLSKRGFLS